MSKLDGLEALEIIRENDGLDSIPVVILTSLREERDLIAEYKHGANNFVCKPINFEELSEMASKLGMYWLLVNEFHKP